MQTLAPTTATEEHLGILGEGSSGIEPTHKQAT